MTPTELHTLDGVVVEGVPARFALHPYGVFTTFVMAEGGVLGWDEHLDRLAKDAHVLWGHPLDATRVTAHLAAHAELLAGPVSVRITLYPGDLAISSPSEARGCRVLISSGPARFPFLPEYPFTVCSTDHVRELPKVKSTSLLTQIHLRRTAQLNGFDDVLLTQGERVLEGATWTVLAWGEDQVVTPPDDDVLRSITAGHLGGIASELGMTFAHRPIRLAELTDARLVLGINANHPARAISRVDGTDVAVDHDLLDQIAIRFSALPRDLVVDLSGQSG